MKRHLDLLPWQVRCRTLLRDRIRVWSVVWGLLALVGISSSVWEWQCLDAAEHEFDQFRRRSDGIQNIQSANDELNEKINVLKARLAKYGHFENERNGFQLLATVSHSAGSCDGDLQVQKLLFTTSEVVETTSPPGQPAAKGIAPAKRTVRVLSLSGVASTNLTVAQFVSALRDSQAFQAVELKSSQGKGHVDAGLRSYQIECNF